MQENCVFTESPQNFLRDLFCFVPSVCRVRFYRAIKRQVVQCSLLGISNSSKHIFWGKCLFSSPRKTSAQPKLFLSSNWPELGQCGLGLASLVVSGVYARLGNSLALFVQCVTSLTISSCRSSLCSSLGRPALPCAPKHWR